MIKNYKLLDKWDKSHLKDAHIRNEYDWQNNIRGQKLWLATYGIERCCRQCVSIAIRLNQWKGGLVVPDDVICHKW
jgi:hypothetical protein